MTHNLHPPKPPRAAASNDLMPRPAAQAWSALAPAPPPASKGTTA